MRITAIVNQKGGCGKTTSAINLASVYAGRGLRTLLVDMDPQAHCAAGLGVPESCVERTIADALLADDPLAVDRAGFVWQVARNLDLAVSSMRLAALEAPGGGLHELPERDRRLERVLAGLAPHYDRCLIDCPPTIGLLTFNALRSAREVLIPVETGYFALKGAQKQWETIQRVIRHIGRPIACHILPTLHDENAELARDIHAALRREFAGQILPIVIRAHAALREAASMGQAISEYAPGSEAHADYEALADWLEDHRVERAIEIEILPHAAAIGGRAAPGFADGDPPADQEPFGSSGMNARAAELAGRLRGGRGPALGGPPEAARSGVSPERTPAPATPPTPVDRERPAAPAPACVPASAPATPDAAPVGTATAPGVTCTPEGAIFAQPVHGDATVRVAGAFNGWNPAATILESAPGSALAQAFVPLAPGRYRYRIVVDGRWLPDPYNDVVETSEHGEPHSVFVVPAAHPATVAFSQPHRAAPTGDATLPQAAP